MNPILHRLKTRFSEWDERFRARELRERVMLAGMAVALTFFVIDTALTRPIQRERNRVSLGMERARADLKRLRQEEAVLTNTTHSEAEKQVKAELDQLERQLREIESRMGAQIADLVPPTKIVSVLEELLSEDRHLKLISLRSQPPIRIGEGTPVATAGDTPGLYRHGIRIEIEGDFRSTVDYLRRLEGSEWHLLWDRFEYRVDSFPTARVTIDLHTLSDREGWIGV